MITREVNEWVKKVVCGNYKREDILYEFAQISKYLTREELIQIKRKLSDYIN